MPMYHDNQVAIFIALNLTFHEYTNYIKIDRNQVLRDDISTLQMGSSNW